MFGFNVMRWSWFNSLGARQLKDAPPGGEAASGDLNQPFEQYEARAPSAQNCIDVVPGWNTRFPDKFGVVAGNTIHFADDRILWAIERYGSITDANVLEIGPMEGAHTFLLQDSGAYVTAVEANKRAFLKCLITKEIVGMPRARFLLGDCVQYLEQNAARYDFIVACGVLYHMVDPLRFLEAVAARTDALYLWTSYIDENAAPAGSSNAKNLGMVREAVDFRGIQTSLYRMSYYDVHLNHDFCGGIYGEPRWMSRTSIIEALKALGFSDLEIAHEAPGPQPTQPCFSIFARRSAAVAAPP
jgi:SAM-dependent methyltransferase